MDLAKVLLFLFLAFFICAFLPVENGDAAYTTVGRNFTSKATDGYSVGIGSNYTTIHEQLNASVETTDVSYVGVGQMNLAGVMYYVYRCMFYFDTSLVPEDAAIVNVTLSLWPYSIQNVTENFNVTVWDGQPNFPKEPMELSDYYYGYYAEVVGFLDSAHINGGVYNNFTIANETVTKGGTTKLMLRSSLDVNFTSPTGTERVFFYSAEAGEAYAPRLYVYYSLSTFNYELHGPYFEDGTTSAGTNITVTVYSDFQLPYTFVLSNPATVTYYQPEQKPNHMVWNISSPAYNYSRFMWFTEAAAETFYLMMPINTTNYDLYFINLNDFTGVRNAYLESIVYTSGQQRVVERQPFLSGNALPFYLTFGGHYTFRLVCDEGTKTWEDVIPGTTETIELVINPDDFVGEPETLGLTISAIRVNDSAISLTFLDSTGETINGSVAVTHITNYTLVADVSQTWNGSAYSWTWTGAEAATDYYVNVTIFKDGAYYSQVCAAPSLTVKANPWSGLFDIFGIWPFPSQYIPGILIMFACISVFSTLSRGEGLIILCAVAGVLNLIGWFNVGWTMLSFATAISIMEVLHQSKKQEQFGA